MGGSLPATPSGGGGGFDAPATGGHPALGTIPGRRFSEKIETISHRESSDFDETEPLGQLTNTQVYESNKLIFYGFDFNTRLIFLFLNPSLPANGPCINFKSPPPYPLIQIRGRGLNTDLKSQFSNPYIFSDGWRKLLIF